MGKDTGISWTTHTWNPWRGCLKVSPGCKICYMYRDQTRYGKNPAEVVRAKPTTFNAPQRWKEPAHVFTCSWSDWFIEEADEYRPEAWEIIKNTPHLIYQILTKRPENIAGRLPADWGAGYPNVWLGVSVESQEYADERIPTLLEQPAALHFLSIEPLLSEVTLNNTDEWLNKVGWVIVGGESGGGYRPMEPAWALSVRDQCGAYGVPFFFKQHGGTKKIDGEWGGNKLSGRTWQDMPKETHV